MSDVLKDADDGVRWNASKSLGILRDPKAVDPLAAALNDSEENVRKAAADALGEIGDPRAVSPLMTAFRLGNRWHTAAALANLRDRRAADLLNARLRQGDLDVVAAARAFFIRRGDLDSVPALIAAMDKFGRWEMAQDYMASGNLRLKDAAHKWASRNGYESLTLSEDRTLTWGSEK